MQRIERKEKMNYISISMKAMNKLFGLSGRLNAICTSLYVFYLLEANKQKTNIIWCNNRYAAKGLKCSVGTIVKYKKLLVELKLISLLIQKRPKRGRFGKTYILIKKT